MQVSVGQAVNFMKGSGILKTMPAWLFYPNWIIPDKEKAFIPALVNDPSDMFQANGKWVEHVQRKEIYPSLKKFSNIKYAYTEQYHMGDFPILRLGDIYLVAA